MPNPYTGTSSARSLLTAKKAIAVGRLCYQKHFDALIKAWRIIADRYPEWTLDIWGGNGPLYESLKRLIVDLKLEEHVFLRGETPDISAKMAESSMIISTSVFEGMPLVLLEALAAGLPIVTFNYQYGADEIVTEGENGFIVEQDDLETLADRIGRLITDEKLRKAMGEKAFVSSKRFLPEVIAERWMALFRNLREEKQDPRIPR
jgi:glycosyltransferase involved in cell wall biosynthesis